MRMNVENADETIQVMNVSYNICKQLLERMRNDYHDAYELSKVNYANLSWFKKMFNDGFSEGIEACVCRMWIQHIEEDLKNIQICIDKTIKFMAETSNTLILSDDEVALLHKYAFGDRDNVEGRFQRKLNSLRTAFL